MGSVFCYEDLAFGPAVMNCRGGFDFTLVFEEIVLSIIPSSLFIVLSALRIWYLYLSESSSSGWRLRAAKFICAAIYSSLQLSIVVTGTQLGTGTQLSAAARSMAFISSTFILPLSILEDKRSTRPSFLLAIYLFMTTLFDIVQTRTQWLIVPGVGRQDVLSSLYTSAVGVKLVLLVLESQSRTGVRHCSPEEKAGPFNLAAYAWLNGLFAKGYRNVLSLEDLPRLDGGISSEFLHDKLWRRFSTSSVAQGRSNFGLAKALTLTLLGPLLLPLLPRLALAGFRFCQPFLIGSLLDHIGNNNNKGNSAWENSGYGFIGASVFIYFGVAISTALYWYCHERFVCMTRGALVAAIYQKLTQLKIVDVSDSAAITLMSTDIERIRVGLWNLHEFWGSALEVGLACWLLYRQLGVAFVAPLVVVMCSVACSSILNRYTGPRQKRWMEHIQTRVAETAHMLSSLKQLKISGLAQPVEESTQQLRVDELMAASKFRTLYVSNMAFGYAPMALCPVITFAIIARDLGTSTIFISMAYLVLLADPLGVLFGEIPYLLTAFTCLGRIQEFLEKEPQSDGRRFIFPATSPSSTESKPTVTEGPSVSIENAHLGWSENKPVLYGVNVRLPASGLTMVIGPVGSGKSTLCKAFVAEIPFASAVLNIAMAASNFQSAFCDQTPFIYNGSIRSNIVGFSTFDSARYRTVIECTLLDSDLRSLAQGDSTVVGSNGITLSGGQRQRVAIARALYHQANFYVFDDPMSGLDTDTQLKVFSRVFGPDGILRQRKATVLLATHNTSYLPLADHIVVLGSDNRVQYEGNFAELVTKDAEGFNGRQFERIADGKDIISSPLETDVEFWETPDRETEGLRDQPPEVPNVHTSFLSEKDRMTGDATVYRYYLASLGKLSIIAFVVFGMGWGFFYNFGYIWLRFWSGDYNQNHSRAFYLGLYALWQAGGLASIVLCYWTSYTMMVRISGSRLHQNALQTIVHAPLSFITSTDIGVITSLFSQDMTLIDNELPVAITNLALDICNAIGIAAVIATSSPYLIISYPILISVLYLVQKFYLRTSRQLRLLDLEAKSPLYTQFLDTARGLATIRSFGWANKSIRVAIDLLDASQKPTYLLAMVQRWLLFVLQCVVAVVAIVVVTLATQVRSNTATFTGASLVALMTFGDVLNFIIRWWTQLETSIGAVTRLKSLSDKVPSESSMDDTKSIPPEWPACGSIHIQDISASYDSNNHGGANGSSDSSEREMPQHLVLKNLTLSIRPGEKVAVCGRTGSGKSSLVLLLLRMLDPLPSCSKSIIVDGVGLDSVSRVDVRDRIIAMSQDPVFLPGEVSIERQLDPCRHSTKEDCHNVLRLVGLSELASDARDTERMLQPESLSAGQKQLFNLARTILRRRSRSKQLVSRSQTGESKDTGGILLLDEVSASVDQETADLQLRIITDEFKSDTIIMVTHHLGMIMDFDTAVVMDRGEIVERGNPRQLVAESGSQFSRLWMAGRGGTE